MQRFGAEAVFLGLIGQRVVAAVGDPDFGGADIFQRLVQFVPVGVVGDDEGQLHPLLFGTGADAHPAGGSDGKHVRELALPAVVECGWGADDDFACQGFGVFGGDLFQRAEGDAEGLVKGAEFDHGPVQIDGFVVAGVAEFQNEALAFAEGICAHQMAAFGKGAQGVQQFLDLIGNRRVREDRQSKRGFGDEDIAGHGLERFAGGVGGAFVIAGEDDAGAGVFDARLGAAEDVAGGVQAEFGTAQFQRFAVGEFVLHFFCVFLAVAGAHDGEGFGRGIHRAMPRAGVVGVAVGNHRPLHGARGVDVEIAGLAIWALGANLDPLPRMHPCFSLMSEPFIWGACIRFPDASPTGSRARGGRFCPTRPPWWSDSPQAIRRC